MQALAIGALGIYRQQVQALLAAGVDHRLQGRTCNSDQLHIGDRGMPLHDARDEMHLVRGIGVYLSIS